VATSDPSRDSVDISWKTADVEFCRRVDACCVYVRGANGGCRLALAGIRDDCTQKKGVGKICDCSYPCSVFTFDLSFSFNEFQSQHFVRL
jgi:hypothetical protein